MNTVRVSIETVRPYGEVSVSVLDHFEDEPDTSDEYVPDDWIVGGAIAEVLAKTESANLFRIVAEIITHLSEHECHKKDAYINPEDYARPDVKDWARRVQNAERRLLAASFALSGLWDEEIDGRRR